MSSQSHRLGLPTWSRLLIDCHVCDAASKVRSRTGLHVDGKQQDGRVPFQTSGRSKSFQRDAGLWCRDGKLRHVPRCGYSNLTSLPGCLVQVLERLSRNSEALGMYQVACDLAPGSAAVKFKRARMLFKVKRYDVSLYRIRPCHGLPSLRLPLTLDVFPSPIQRTRSRI